VLTTVTLAFALLLISVLLTVSVNQRLGEIAALRALGFSRGGWRPTCSASRRSRRHRRRCCRCRSARCWRLARHDPQAHAGHSRRAALLRLRAVALGVHARCSR
jgi:hypothetical protein